VRRRWARAAERVAAVALALVVGLGCLLAAPAGAAADEIDLAVFAPAAQFSSMQDRLELGRRLAEHLRKSLPETSVKSRVYARASDFDSAVASASIDLALVDATYLAMSKLKQPRVLAMTPPVVWHLVASSSLSSVSELWKKRLHLAAGGSRGGGDGFEVELADGFFNGEARPFFSYIGPAQDSTSALVALSFGKADAVLMPVSDPTSFPEGTRSIYAFEPMPGMVLVALSRRGSDHAKLFLPALDQFKGAAPVRSFSLVSPDVDLLAALRARLKIAPREAPMPTLPLRALIDSLVTSGSLSIPQQPAVDFALTPAAAAATLAPPPPPPASPSSPRRRR
jgi:hypothetical protein